MTPENPNTQEKQHSAEMRRPRAKRKTEIGGIKKVLIYRLLLTLTLIEDIEMGDLDQNNIDQDEDYYLELEIRERIC